MVTKPEDQVRPVDDLRQAILGSQITTLILTGIGRLPDQILQQGLVDGYTEVRDNDYGKGLAFLCAIANDMPRVIETLNRKELINLISFLEDDDAYIYNDDHVNVGENLLKTAKKKTKKKEAKPVLSSSVL